MPVFVPESVFDKYYDVIDSTFTIFGVICQLVSIDKVEELSKIKIVQSLQLSITNHLPFISPGLFINNSLVFPMNL